jgi:hypothetical protein
VAAKKKKRPKRTAIDFSPAAEARRRWIRGALVITAALYVATVWLDGVGSTFPSKLLPRPWVYFAQVAALFTTASPKIIDYRAEGWVCAEKKWVEVDVRPYFPLDAENKENRFQRVLQFYRKNRTVMRSLEDFVMRRYNATASKEIGGVRFLSLRIPYPAPGEHVTPYERRPLASYPKDQRKDWYWTPRSKRAERCREEGSGEPGEDDARDLDKLFSDPSSHSKDDP